MNAWALCALIGLAISVAGYAAASAALLQAHRRTRCEPPSGCEPGVSILKPLCGVDEDLARNLESFFLLEYAAYELIFSFASRADPAYAIARRVADAHPGIRSLFVFDAREPGGNAKVNRLSAALRHARHRLVLFSDGNVSVRPDFLRRAVAAFADPRVGLVSHLFWARGAAGAASRIETLYLNGCLQGGTALISGWLRMPCVVGKSILVSKPALDVIGGVDVLREFLAEDFRLGREMHRAGYRVALSADFVDTAEVRKRARAVWSRHRRWAMMRRRLGGPLYACELFMSPMPWFIAAIAASRPGVTAAAAGLLAMRYLVEVAVAVRLDRPMAVWDMALLPVRDLAVAALFWAGLTGQRVSWRGRPMRIGRGTLIVGPPRAA